MNGCFQAKRILFFVPENNVEKNGVYASQVLGLARYCANQGARCLIFHYDPAGKAGIRALEPGIDIVSDVTARRYRQFWFKTKDLRFVARRFWKELISFSPTHIYTREFASCRAAKELALSTRAKLIYSMRGPDVYERMEMGGVKNWIASLYISWAVRDAMRICDRFQTMSIPFARWNKRKYCRDAIVYQCCVTDRFFTRISEPERQKIRSGLGFSEGDKVVVWCGAYFTWQRIEEIACLMRDVNRLDSTVKSLFILKDAERMDAFCRKINFKEGAWASIALSPSQVPAYLQSSDVGINCLAVDVFRSKIVSPIKVGEYLASGLPVLITRTMGDVPEIIKEFNVGAILDDALTPSVALDDIKLLCAVKCERAIECAKKYYSWDANKEKLSELFA